MSSSSVLKLLNDNDLAKSLDEVFDIICKIGKGSYGSVYKALHKESGQVLAIKQVPVDTDLQEIIKEISIMQQCDSPYIVKYYGSYFKNTDLWIVMEYCGAGSVSDILKLRNKTLTEDEIATILLYTLKGLEYLHDRRKIHRDIKAGNILLNTDGHAKLADFGVAGQLTDTMAKRNTVIGTPFWMAPEVIQEIGYDCVADIWSLGITALEMAEAKPPYGDIHPMRAIFMIPTKPPPSFRHPDNWSQSFIDFVSRCLVKNPCDRATAKELLQHDFIQNSKPCTVLHRMILEAREIHEAYQAHEDESKEIEKLPKEEEEVESGGTMLNVITKDGTIVKDGTGTIIPKSSSNTGISQNSTLIDIESELGTMVINDTDDEDGTMKDHSSNDGSGNRSKYRPAFLDHFEAKEREKQESLEKTRQQQQLQQEQMNQVQKSNSVVKSSDNSPAPVVMRHNPVSPPIISNFPSPMMRSNLSFFQQSMYDNDYNMLQNLSFQELQNRIALLDPEMEKEIEELHKRYLAKRQPILDAIDAKKQQVLNF